jgi:hypothetical protein
MFLFISTIEQIEVCNIIVILLGFSCVYSTSPIYGRLAHIYTYYFLKAILIISYSGMQSFWKSPIVIYI